MSAIKPRRNGLAFLDQRKVFPFGEFASLSTAFIQSAKSVGFDFVGDEGGSERETEGLAFKGSNQMGNARQVYTLADSLIDRAIQGQSNQNGNVKVQKLEIPVQGQSNRVSGESPVKVDFSRHMLSREISQR